MNDELLVKIASRRQNVTEVNISDCRNVQDHGVCSLASQSAGLLKYTAYRCKQLSDLSLCTIATHCPLLAKIHVGNQDKLTDHALKLVSVLLLSSSPEYHLSLDVISFTVSQLRITFMIPRIAFNLYEL